MKNLYIVKDYVKNSLYNSIVEITEDDENIDYESIEKVIELAIDLVANISWDCAIDFVKKDMKKLFKEKEKDEIPDV